MPGFELIGKEEQNAVNDIFEKSNGVLFAHGFDERRNPDISLANKILNWSPKVDRRQGLAKTIEYFKKLPKSELDKVNREFN